METFKKLIFLLNYHEKKNAVFLLIMSIIMALLDMIGVASILPFMTVLTNTSLIETNFILNTMFKASSIFGVQNNQQFIFILGIILFFILIISQLFKAFTTYLQFKFILMLEHSISKRLVEGYLYQPYSWFLNRNSADLGKTILSEVSNVVGNGVGKLMEIITKGAVSIAILILLIIVDLKLTLIVGFTLSVVYFLIYYGFKDYLSEIGEKSLKNNQHRFIAISEAFGAAKEIKVGALEQTYIKSFSNSSEYFTRFNAFSLIISSLPRFFLEIIAFGGVILLILYIMAKSDSFIDALPVISLYVFAGYRLMPAAQGIFASFTQLTFVIPSLDKLYDDIKNIKISKENQDQTVIPFNKTINLKNIHFSYPDISRTTLKDVTLNIPAKSTVGFVGATGSGKTTTVDIILGLLDPQKGTLEVDGKVITEHNSRSWQRNIGYVPQYIYLSDDTIAANIAFGVATKDIDQEAVEKVSKIACLHEFVLNELPKKYQTLIGERGVRLSGGQRQRIGIARALYHNPQVIIFDEATSALDNITEKNVMDAISNYRKNITTIIVAHRLNTVKNCYIIYLFDKGKIKSKGTYDELINLDQSFRMNADN
jgi:ABC-type multidrug transport system fused ATPase/permease subunit